MGFPDPRKVTVLALIPLSLGTFGSLLLANGGIQGEITWQDKTSFSKSKARLYEKLVWLTLDVDVNVVIDGNHRARTLIAI